MTIAVRSIIVMGRTTYYHQMLSGVIVHPDKKEVIPIAPEPISKRDGTSKNDCEVAELQQDS